jgi:hypothetical protein
MARLLKTHTLLGQDNILFKMELLGGLKPSQVLASMLAYCSPSIGQTSMFQNMFLLWFPCTLRTLLVEQEPGDIRSLASRADRLCVSHKQQDST